MTTLNFSKDIDAIEEPEPIQENWYVAIVTKDVEILPNKKKQDGATYEDGGGDNLIISLRLDTEGEADGRSFKVYLPFPSKEDESTYDGIGMIKYDAKLQKIAAFAEAATGCSVDGNEITIHPNARVGVYVQQGLDQQGEKVVNSIEAFKHGFMPPDQIEFENEDGEDNDEAAPL